MKRICFLPVVLLLTGLLCGCTGQQQNDPSPQEHNHAMEEGTETPKYDHLTVYSPLPESETLLYCSAFRKDDRHYRGLYLSSCRRNDRAARAGAGQPAGFCAAGRLGG